MKPPANAGDVGSVPGSGRSPGEGNGNPLQYSCLESPKDRGAWWLQESDTTEQLKSSMVSSGERQMMMLRNVLAERPPPSGQEPYPERAAPTITTSRDHQPPPTSIPTWVPAASPSREGAGPGTCPFSFFSDARDQRVRMVGRGGRACRTCGLKSSPLRTPSSLPPQPPPWGREPRQADSRGAAPVQALLFTENRESFFSTHLPWASPTARRSVVPGTRHSQRWGSPWGPFQNPNPRFCGFKEGVLISMNTWNATGLQKFQWRSRNSPFPSPLMLPRRAHLSASSRISQRIWRKWMFLVDFIWSTRRPGVEIRIFIPFRSLFKSIHHNRK